MAKIENVEKWGRKTARERYNEGGDVKPLPVEPSPSPPSNASPGGVRRLPRPSSPPGYQGGFPGNPR
jgi:hypothetical protein